MKKIEERALEFAENHREMYSLESSTMIELAYLQGATDQKQIDIEKACKWLHDNIEPEKLENSGGEVIGTYTSSRELIESTEFIERFRKAMEGNLWESF